MYKEYFEKLEKLKGKELKNTELKGGKKIELGLVDDISARSKGVSKDIKNLLDLTKQIHSAAKKGRKGYVALEKTVKAQEKELSQAKKAFKELGVSAEPLKKYEAQISEAAAHLHEFKRYISNIK